MSKIWKVVLTVALTALILGAVCIGVSFITGADMGRISSAFTELYDIDRYAAYIDSISEQLSAASAMLK